MNNTNTPVAEVKVQIRTSPGGEWTDSVDFDPITVPVELTVNDLPHSTDPFNPTVIALSDGIIDAESSFSEHQASMMTDYRLVWSATGELVHALCPVCDDDFIISEGAPGDEFNEGYDAVFCGCDPADSVPEAND